MSKDVILTGLRSNSEFHIGNYFGAIKPIIELQNLHKDKYQIHMFVPDLHSFTTPINHTNLYVQTVNNIKAYIAAGLNVDSANTYVYRQSYISAHSELAWILSCFTYVGELSRMTQYKEKSSDSKSTSGLFNYPVLMAADILLYNSNWVPVGEDQRQHLELARDIAIRFNNKFNNTFTVPYDWVKQLQFRKLDKGLRIRSLRNPSKKMSKSIDDPAGTILLSDNPEVAAKKVLSATTDSLQQINYNWENQPGISNLLQILALISDHTIDEVSKAWTGKTSYGDLKDAVATELKNFLENYQSRLSKIDDKAVITKLEKDETLVRQIANEKLLEVQRKVGLRSKN